MKKHNYKLTAKDINKILRYKEQGVSLRDIAKMIGISQQGVWNVIRGYKRTEKKSNGRRTN